MRPPVEPGRPGGAARIHATPVVQLPVGRFSIGRAPRPERRLRLPLLERRELRRPFASVPLLNTSGGFGVPLSLVRLPLRFSVEIALPLLAARHVQHSRSGLKASPLDAHTRSVISQRLVRANMPSTS